VILYLSYFYKHHELTLRLGFFWTAMSIADILSSLLAYGILHMRGVQGHSGWKWLFLIEVCATVSLQLFGLCGRFISWARLTRYTGSADACHWSLFLHPDASWAMPDGELVPRQERVVHRAVGSISARLLWVLLTMCFQRGDDYCQPRPAGGSEQERHA